MRITRIAASLVVLGSANALAQSKPADAPMPATGLDFTAVDQFWRVVDVLQKDVEPSEAQWQAFLSTPGSRLAQIAIGPVIKEDLELAFKPSQRRMFDSLTKLTNGRATRLTHLVRAASMRSQLNAFRDSLTRTTPVAAAVKTAGRYLPPGATNTGDCHSERAPQARSGGISDRSDRGNCHSERSALGAESRNLSTSG